jgi:HSP20 family molecular chaperone IbpA
VFFLLAAPDYYEMSVIQVIWGPPSSHQKQTQTHHFHFPPTSLLAANTRFGQHLRAQGRKLSHAAYGERGVAGDGSISSWSPNTDIRQTKLAYHIEIEVPGTTDKETLLIQWLSPSTLIVRGQIERPFIGHGKAAEGAYQFQQSEESADGYPTGNATGSRNMEGRTTNDSGKLKTMTTDLGDEFADIPLFLLEERKTGPWQRTFTLPHDADMKALKARLEGGLLRIDIPTKDVSGEPGIKVEIE